MKQLLVAVAILAGLFLAVDHADAATPRQWSPCITEDQTAPRCVWDAAHRGNKEGHSFFVNARGRHYISDARAYAMLHR